MSRRRRGPDRRERAEAHEAASSAIRPCARASCTSRLQSAARVAALPPRRMLLLAAVVERCESSCSRSHLKTPFVRSEFRIAFRDEVSLSTGHETLSSSAASAAAAAAAAALSERALAERREV